MASVTFFLGMVPEQTFPEGSPISHFMASFGPTGYMTFVKVLELLGGLLIMIPKTRNLGLLVLGPIIVNIVAFTLFVAGGNLLDPMLLAICALALYLMWAERSKWRKLVA
ncbi:MAG: hypothetical protein KDK99_08945, partial [Verrucomicrobiales bacterium]|nr:hypothetical protein [Verrucomicrobiales bacterium]